MSEKYKDELPANSFIAEVDDSLFAVEFLDNRDLDGEWYCIITFGGKYIAGEGDPDKEMAWNLAMHNVLVWLHCVQVQLDEFWDEVDERFDD